MACHCPTCGCEFEDVNEMVEHKRAALAAQRTAVIQGRIEAQRSEAAMWERAYEAWGYPEQTGPVDPTDAALALMGRRK